MFDKDEEKKEEENEELLNSETTQIEGGKDDQKSVEPSQDWCDQSCLITCTSNLM